MDFVLKGQSHPREDSEMSQYWQSHSKRNKIKLKKKKGEMKFE